MKKDNPPTQEANPVSPPSESEKAPSRDVVLLHSPTEDNKGFRVLRARDQTLELGEVRPLVPGQPIHNDVVRLHPRKEAPFVCDVETTYSVPRELPPSDTAQKRPTGAGPAQVASRAYRDNWDAVWARGAAVKGSSELN